MTEKEALGMILDLASQNLLDEKDCDGEDALLDCMVQQQEAMDIVMTMYEKEEK
jgi:hypothetical protein